MTLYDGLTSLHVIAGIAWMAGTLYLPRFTSSRRRQAGLNLETFKIMERRLLRAIINPP
jgi:putative membrane protein